jgi:hypothetical protein
MTSLVPERKTAQAQRVGPAPIRAKLVASAQITALQLSLSLLILVTYACFSASFLSSHDLIADGFARNEKFHSSVLLPAGGVIV